MTDVDERLRRARAVRAALHAHGPHWSRPFEGDVECVALPPADCDILRDALIAHGTRTVIEIGLAYGSSALAIGEALCSAGVMEVSHIIIDPFQATAFHGVGWSALEAAQLDDHTTLITEASSVALPRLVSESVAADAAFVDGSHRFHEVFVDLYYLRKLVRPGGLIVLDDVSHPPVATALRYFDRNLAWRPVAIGGRLTARQLPDVPFEPEFTDFRPF